MVSSKRTTNVRRMVKDDRSFSQLIRFMHRTLVRCPLSGPCGSETYDLVVISSSRAHRVILEQAEGVVIKQ